MTFASHINVLYTVLKMNYLMAFNLCIYIYEFFELYLFSNLATLFLLNILTLFSLFIVYY